MTDARVGESPAIVVAGVSPPLRVAEGPVIAVAAVSPPVAATEAPILVVASVRPPVAVAEAPILVVAAHTDCATRWCQICTIIRTDGAVFRFTSLDRDLEWNGDVYQACGGFLPSATESAAEVGSIGNQELAGLFSAVGVTQDDLAAGLFDGAAVVSWRIPWDGSTATPRALQRGVLAKTTRRPSGYKAELLGDGARLQQQPLTRVLKPDCDYTFGDGRTCRKDLTPLQVAGSVEAADGEHVFIDTSRGEPPGYFRRGRVTFTSGANAGISAEIRDHLADGVFELWPRLANPIVAGDNYSMTPGCTNLKASDGGCNGCVAWDNVVNYGGFDLTPGGDALLSTQGVRTG